MTAFGTLELRNFRCFDWNNPATLEFGDGFTAYIGPNNSGKSSALRSVYELRTFFPALINTFIPSNAFRMGVSPQGATDVTELANDQDPTKFTLSFELPNPSRPPQPNTALAIHATFQFETGTGHLTARQLRTQKDGVPKTYSDAETKEIQKVSGSQIIVHKNGEAIDFSQLHEFAMQLCYSRYFPAFRNAINEGAGNYYDLPVGTGLVNTWDQWKAGSNRAQKIAISKVEEQIAKLLGFHTLQINADQTNKTLDVIINGRPQKLYEVGAGVAQLIIVFAAALVHKPPYILIDEPELNLHPSLQLDFLTTLGSYTQKGLLFSTHSIGLARSSAHRIYTMHKPPESSAKMRLFGDHQVNFAEWLGELSYSDRVELGCEGLVLVEGPSEVLCFQELLRKIQLDKKYVLMQLGGSSLINKNISLHLEELKRLVDPARIHVFIDSERKGPTDQLPEDRAAFLAACRALGVRAQASERRATENYFEANGITRALGPEFQPLEPYQLLKDAPKPWRKSENWKIARETSWDDIKDTDLGNFLSALVSQA